MSTSTHNPEAEAIRRRRHRALNSLLLTMLCVGMAAVSYAPIVCVRIKRDSNGQPILRSDGSRVSERDWVGDMKVNGGAFSFIALAFFFGVRGIVIFCRPLPSTKAHE